MVPPDGELNIEYTPHMQTTDYFEQLGTGLPFDLDPQFDVSGWFVSSDEYVRALQPNAILEGRTASIGEGVSIGTSVFIDNEVYIGDSCQIGHGVTIRHGAVLGDGCVVNSGAEIKRTIALAGAKIGSGAFVGDSILGRGARIGSGAIIANRRFDQGDIYLGGRSLSTESVGVFCGSVIGDWARIGANAICSPGTLVGKHTWIGGGVHAYGSIAPHKLVMLKQEWDVRDKPDVQLH